MAKVAFKFSQSWLQSAVFIKLEYSNGRHDTLGASRYSQLCPPRQNVYECVSMHTHTAHTLHTMGSFDPLFSELSNSIARHRGASPGWQEEQSQEQGHSAALGRKAPFPVRVAPGTRGELHGSAGGEILSSLPKALIEALKLSEELGRVRGACSV